MPGEGGDGFLGLQVPQFDRVVMACRSQYLAIGAKGDAINRITMPGEGRDLFLGLQVP